jgi:hypothetical protein
MDKQTEIAVDIGGGKGEYFLKRALAEPQKMFVVLDPQVDQIPNKPNNLVLIRWKTDKDTNLPFRPNSIDEVSMNMIMGELRTRDDVGKIDNDMIPFRRLLKETKGLLKENGTVTIVEPKDNIDRVKRLLGEEGYEVVSPVSKVADENRSVYIGIFFDLFRRGKKNENESILIPQEIKARVAR